MRIKPRQFVFGSVEWAGKPGRPQPTHLTFALGDAPSARSISISVADVGIPPHCSSHDPQNAWQSTAYGLLTSAADPATLATLIATVTAPDTVTVPSTLRYTVTLTNTTNTAVPLNGCLQFSEQLSVVPLKYPTTVGAHGPLNCAHLPHAITADSSVTMQMQLDTAGQVAGPGWLTWQLLDHGREATAVTAPLTVQGNQRPIGHACLKWPRSAMGRPPQAPCTSVSSTSRARAVHRSAAVNPSSQHLRPTGSDVQVCISEPTSAWSWFGDRHNETRPAPLPVE